tara:strand:+ start:415 stop:909 length:495 start_codon:yes stop_codon:yes gene_type:complete
MIVNIRKIKLSDKEGILQWRNDINSRKNSLNTKLLNNDEHHEWYTKIIHKYSDTCFIAENGKKKLDFIFYKIKSYNKLYVSINLITHKDFLGFKTYITQEMLKRGFLASTLFYASVCHDEKSINQYFESLDEIFKVIGKIINDESNIKDFLDGPISGTSFKRLN